MPSSSAVRSCCGLSLRDVCSWCSESAKISGRKLDNILVHYRSRQQQWVAILRRFFRFEELLEAFCLVQQCVGTCLAVRELHQVRSAMGGPLAV